MMVYEATGILNCSNGNKIDIAYVLEFLLEQKRLGAEYVNVNDGQIRAWFQKYQDGVIDLQIEKAKIW